MSRNHNINFGTVTIAASGVAYLDIDLVDLPYLHLGFITDASPATMTINVYQGFGFEDPIFQNQALPQWGQFFIFNATGSTIPTWMQNDIGPIVLANDNTSAYLTWINETAPRWVRFKFTNTDTGSHTMNVLGDY